MGTERATKVCAAARDGGLFRGGKEGRERPRGREGGRGKGPDLASEAERRRFSEEEAEFGCSMQLSERGLGIRIQISPLRILTRFPVRNRHGK